jgi:hypothetical protein|tara:strand:+ start:1577 stop:2125 length:549 start_codon:yes stop_codon:yes gene_type:complete
VRIIKLLFFLSIISNNAFSQQKNIWFTYGQSTFLSSPGIEFNSFVNNSIGYQLGINTYFLNYIPNQIVNISNDDNFNFYNANLGICSNILNINNSSIALTLGFKIYYGPEFKALHYYKDEDYYIYFDSSELRPEYGIDFGLSYSYRKITAILKFDSARRNLRFGLGYIFGKNKSKQLKKYKM